MKWHKWNQRSLLWNAYNNGETQKWEGEKEAHGRLASKRFWFWNSFENCTRKQLLLLFLLYHHHRRRHHHHHHHSPPDIWTRIFGVLISLNSSQVFKNWELPHEVMTMIMTDKQDRIGVICYPKLHNPLLLKFFTFVYKGDTTDQQ